MEMQETYKASDLENSIIGMPKNEYIEIDVAEKPKYEADIEKTNTICAWYIWKLPFDC